MPDARRASQPRAIVVIDDDDYGRPARKDRNIAGNGAAVAPVKGRLSVPGSSCNRGNAPLPSATPVRPRHRSPTWWLGLWVGRAGKRRVTHRRLRSAREPAVLP